MFIRKWVTELSQLSRVWVKTWLVKINESISSTKQYWVKFKVFFIHESILRKRLRVESSWKKIVSHYQQLATEPHSLIGDYNFYNCNELMKYFIVGFANIKGDFCCKWCLTVEIIQKFNGITLDQRHAKEKMWKLSAYFLWNLLM